MILVTKTSDQTRLYVYIYACMYVCMYVCMYICIYVSMYLCLYVCIYLSISLYIYMVVSYTRAWIKSGMITNPARGQLNKENECFPVPVRA